MKHKVICNVVDSNKDVAGHIECELPFMPYPGLIMSVDGNFRNVEEVYYSHDDGRIEVYLEHLDTDSKAMLKEWGWKPGEKL